MKKTDFFITKGHPAPGNRINYSFEQVRGYADTFAAPDGTQITVCFDRRGTWWYATEASTGTCIFGGSTRAELVAQLTPEIIGDIATAIQHERSQAIARQLAAHISARRGAQ